MTNETFLLIPGRTSRQGTSLNVGKYSDDYKDETQALSFNREDMQRLGLNAGDRVKVSTTQGCVELACKEGAKDEIPPGLLFLPYGPPVCQLIGGETHGTGMPDSKGFDVTVEKV